MKNAFDSLSEEYSDENYIKLRNTVGLFLVISNCRRPGEVERIEKDVLDNIDQKKNMYRLVVRGKRNKTVPILFNEEIYLYIKLLLSLKEKARINKRNPFLFANIRDTISHNYSYVRLSSIMPTYADACGALIPETLRATKFRKQIATHSASQGFDERQVGNLSEYLGHTDLIHRKNYRTLTFERELDTIQHIERAQGINTTEMLESTILI